MKKIDYLSYYGSHKSVYTDRQYLDLKMIDLKNRLKHVKVNKEIEIAKHNAIIDEIEREIDSLESHNLTVGKCNE